MARGYPHRKADSVYGRIRAVLASDSARLWRVGDVHARVPGVSRQALAEKLHKLARRRQIVRVEVPGERFARWQA